MNMRLTLDRVDRSQPWIKKTAVDLLAQPRAIRAMGEATILAGPQKKYAGSSHNTQSIANRLTRLAS
jgi:hypothetical protein